MPLPGMLILASSHIAHIFTDLTKKEVGGERFPLSSGGRCLTQAEIPKRQKIDNLITNCEVKHFSVFCCLSSGQRRYSYLLRVGLCERHTGEMCVGHYVDIPDMPDLSIVKRDTQCCAQTCFCSLQEAIAVFHSALSIPCQHQVSPKVQLFRPPPDYMHQFHRR